MIDIREVLKQMRELIRLVHRPNIDEVAEWADAIEEAMREPVAEIFVIKALDEWNFVWRASRDKVPPGTKLFAFPPDAAKEIERLKMERDEARKLASDWSNEGGAEIERLKEEIEEVNMKRFAQLNEDRDEIERLEEALQAFKDFDDLPMEAKRPDVFELKVRRPILKALDTKPEPPPSRRIKEWRYK